MLQGMTAHYLAHATYPIQPDDAVLIHAGAGGVGLLLTQMAKRLARVSSPRSPPTRKLRLPARRRGRNDPLHPRRLHGARPRATGGRGLPVVYDSVGKTTFDGSLACLRPRGMLVLFGGSSGAVPPFDLIRLSTMGSLYVTRPTLKNYTATREELEQRAGDVLRWVADETLKLRLEHTYPLADAAQAHRDLEARKTTGKVLLIPEVGRHCPRICHPRLAEESAFFPAIWPLRRAGTPGCHPRQRRIIGHMPEKKADSSARPGVTDPGQ